MADHLKRAMHLAHDRGMKLVPLHHTDRLADIFCATCGWPTEVAGEKKQI